jgi:hypothetical protein
VHYWDATDQTQRHERSRVFLGCDVRFGIERSSHLHMHATAQSDQFSVTHVLCHAIRTKGNNLVSGRKAPQHWTSSNLAELVEKKKCGNFVAVPFRIFKVWPNLKLF